MSITSVPVIAVDPAVMIFYVIILWSAAESERGKYIYEITVK